jgi:hypothetical protein
MQTKKSWLKPGAALVLMSGLFAGCKSEDTTTSVSAGAYYGTGFYDPWYHGAYYYPPDVIVTPPDRPIEPPHPAHPIAPPPPAVAAPAPRPMPSIPSMPRPSFRR